MSFGLGRGKHLDPGAIGLTLADLPPLPDAILTPHTDASGAHEVVPEAWLDPRDWFPHPERPFEVEIGSGKGAFLVEQAARKPEVNFLGFEWAREFFAYAADRCRRRGIENVRLLNADATEFLRWRMPAGIVSILHLYFSDPWPKPRHHKRRVVQDTFLADAHRALASGGELRIVTDHADYWRWMEERFDRWCAPDHVPRFTRLPFTADRRAAGAGEGELVGTNFERKYSREGRPFYAAALCKMPPDES